MIYDIIIFIIALAVLIKASRFLVESAAKLAKSVGVSEFVIGLSLVAIGTSLPELVSSISAAFYKNSGLIMGNIVGSNIANIALVLATGAIIVPLAISRKIFMREGIFLLFSSVLFYVMAITGKVIVWQGILMLVLYTLYIIYIAENEVLKGAFLQFVKQLLRAKIGEGITSIKTAYGNYKRELHDTNGDQHIPALFVLKELAIILGACIALYFSSNYLIPAAHNIALGLHVPDSVIGVTLLAIGTSLPELTVSLIAIKQGKGDLLVGNILGSNIANILLIIGVSSIISPIAVSAGMIYFFMPVMLLVTVLFLAFIKTNWVVRIFEGGLLLGIYVLFLVVMIYLIKIGFLSTAF